MSSPLFLSSSFSLSLSLCGEKGKTCLLQRRKDESERERGQGHKVSEVEEKRVVQSVRRQHKVFSSFLNIIASSSQMFPVLTTHDMCSFYLFLSAALSFCLSIFSFSSSSLDAVSKFLVDTKRKEVERRGSLLFFPFDLDH